MSTSWFKNIISEIEMYEANKCYKLADEATQKLLKIAGKFDLKGVPYGEAMESVIELAKYQRLFDIPECQTLLSATGAPQVYKDERDAIIDAQEMKKKELGRDLTEQEIEDINHQIIKEYGSIGKKILFEGLDENSPCYKALKARFPELLKSTPKNV